MTAGTLSARRIRRGRTLAELGAGLGVDLQVFSHALCAPRGASCTSSVVVPGPETTHAPHSRRLRCMRYLHPATSITEVSPSPRQLADLNERILGKANQDVGRPCGPGPPVGGGARGLAA